MMGTVRSGNRRLRVLLIDNRTCDLSLRSRVRCWRRRTRIWARAQRLLTTGQRKTRRCFYVEEKRMRIGILLTWLLEECGGEDENRVEGND
ncbi:hypothetical protein AN958_01775 [Leucoagaricus sp. SymC.cos]|nr:hypothetical protein AN958_01775 [Leucoagaricus sp. SymC.cos]